MASPPNTATAPSPTTPDEQPAADVALFGKDPMPRLVDVEPIMDGPSDEPARVRLYQRSEDFSSVIEHEETFYPFFFLSDITLLRGLRDTFQFTQMEGDNFYDNLVVFRTWNDYWDAIRQVERHTDSDQQQPEEIYRVGAPAQQYLMQTGRTCLLDMTRFLTAWRRRCQREEAFCLALCRVRQEEVSHDREFDAENGYLRRLLDNLDQKLPSQGLAGSYGSACFILYLPGTGPEEARDLLHSLLREDTGGNSYVFRAGIGYYPCLNYTRLDVAETARNALEHAELLSGNAVTVFDSLSLTVSADRHYARGDLAKAITDYQQALLLDPDNHLARNSLAICHAHLGKNSRAQQEFQELLARDPDHVIALYNNGCLSLKMEQLDAAEENLQRCLKLQPEQHFCLIRLGQIREKKGDFRGARNYYQRANNTPQGPRYAYKHLARLDHLHGDLRAARDNLQKAVQANPWDAEALHLLARIYLEAGEDPELVESLAKRSYSLRPDLEEHLRLLEEILISRGKQEEARHFRLGAEE